MAEGLSETISEMDNRDLQCSICMDTYKEPKVLPCLHSFCKACLKGMMPQQDVSNTLLPMSDATSDPMSNNSPSEVAGVSEACDEFYEAIPELGDNQSMLVSEPNAMPGNEEPIVCFTEMNPRTYEGSPYDGLAKKIPSTDDDSADGATENFCLPTLAQIGQGHVELESALSVGASLECQEATIICPVCKAKHCLPLGGVEDLADDFELLDRLEKCCIEQSLAKKEIKCAECSSDESVEDYCRTCAGALCKYCVRAHSRQRIYADHEIVPSINLTPETFISPKKRKSCSRHNKEIVLFCLECKQLICAACVVPAVGGHCDHDFRTLEDTDEAYLVEAQELIRASEINLKKFHKSKEYLQGLEKVIVTSSHNELVVKRINSEFDKCIQVLQNRRDQLLGEVETEANKLKKDIWSEKDYVEVTITKIHSGVKFAQRAQKCTNLEERIGMNAQAISRLKEVVGATWSQSAVASPKLFKPCAQQPSVETLSSWGTLATVSDDDITFEMEEAQPCVCQPLLVTVQFSVGILCDPVIQILYGRSEQILDPNEVVMYDSQEDNCYNIEFVPRVAGQHILEIWIGGVSVSRKEFSVKGKLRKGNKVQIGPDWNCEISDVGVGTVMRSRSKAKAVSFIRRDSLPDAERVSVDWGGGMVKDHNWGESDEYEIELIP